MKKILILIFITSINIMAANSNIKISFEMLSKMKPQEAYQIALPLAKEGDGVAQVFIGEMYKTGKDLPKDIDKAKKWMTESYNNLLPLAKNGNAQAQYIIGRFYDDKDSLVLPYNREKALFWYEKAAKQNYTLAITSIINVYSGIELDAMMNKTQLPEEIEKKLFYWNKYGAEKNIVSCQDSVANAYMQGKGTKKDTEKAEYWYKKSFDGFIRLAKEGDKTAIYSLAGKYHNGEGVKKDEELAIFWFNKITDDFYKGLALSSLTGFYFPNDEKTYDSEVFYWNKRAAELGDKNAQINLSFMYKNGNVVKKDLNKAFFWLNKAVTNDGSFSAFSILPYKVDEYYSLALMYILGEGTDTNYKKAIPLLERSVSNEDNPRANLALGIIYEIHEKDIKKAKEYFSHACEQKNDTACEKYDELKKRETNLMVCRMKSTGDQYLFSQSADGQYIYFHNNKKEPIKAYKKGKSVGGHIRFFGQEHSIYVYDNRREMSMRTLNNVTGEAGPIFAVFRCDNKLRR